MASELERISAIRDQSQTIGEFLDWLQNEQGVVLAKWQDYGTNCEPRYLFHDRPQGGYTRERYNELFGESWEWHETGEGTIRIRVPNPAFKSWPSGFFPVHRSITDWLALYF